MGNKTKHHSSCKYAICLWGWNKFENRDNGTLMLSINKDLAQKQVVSVKSSLCGTWKFDTIDKVWGVGSLLKKTIISSVFYRSLSNLVKPKELW